jgi:hypothetical protein
MNIEFHYYMTYLIAAHAGFSANESEIIAYASQYVDENTRILHIDVDKPTHYTNYITQTRNILKPKNELMRIYPIFHFIPGDPMAVSAYRKDGKFHRLNTTPNSENANLIFDSALHSGNLYRIGIATHSYVDTWAHQNFVGYYDDFNAMTGVLSKALPNIGHADAKHNPDEPALIWRDCRLIRAHEQVDNRARFLEAASHLFYKFRLLVDPSCSQTRLTQDTQVLKQTLDTAIGASDPSNEHVQDRIHRYIALSQTTPFGQQTMPTFDAKRWFNQALTHQVRGVSDDYKLLSKVDPLKDQYAWLPDYTSSHWYQFQEAAKSQQKSAWGILKERVFSTLELENL